jgi:hypothetical protein
MHKLQIYITVTGFRIFFKFGVRTDNGADVSKQVEVVENHTFTYLCIHLLL